MHVCVYCVYMEIEIMNLRERKTRVCMKIVGERKSKGDMI